MSFDQMDDLDFIKIGKAHTPELKQKLQKSFDFVANDELRPVMNGVLFDFDTEMSKNENDVALVGTDAHWVSIDIIDLPSKNKVDFILPDQKIIEKTIGLFENERCYCLLRM